MVFYFSGTGNSKHTAQVIAQQTNDTAVNIVDAIKDRIYPSSSDEVTGFVFPVYFWGLPEIIERFAKIPEVKTGLGKYVFSVITCGASTGNADKMLAKKLGRKLDYNFSLRMPDNYVVMYDPCSKEKAQKFLRHADREIARVCDDVLKREKGRKGSCKDGAKSAFVSILYDPFRRTKKFYATDACISCGLCEKSCPDEVIKLENGKPIWIKPKCQHCTACINRCPQRAIQYGKATESRIRYNYEEAIK